MTASETIPIAWPRIRWFHWALLALILAAAAGIRWDRIDKQSLWIDEYWALYLSTGRGDQLFKITQGAVLDPPPNVGFAAAPGWWHIWTGLSSVTHPPLYFLALRACVDLVGSSDRAIRSMSAIFSLASIAVLFSLVRRIRGAGAGLIAAGIMAFAPMQIDYSQTTRPYTLLVLLSVLFCHALLSIQFRSPTRRRAILLGVSVMAMALTHYFSIGAILGAIIYTVIRLTGKARATALMAMTAGLVLAAILWGPFLWQIRGSFNAFPEFAKASGSWFDSIVRAVVTTPAQVFLEPGGSWNWLQSFPLAVLVYVAPLLLARKSAEMLLWWLWIVGTIAALLAVDTVRGTTLVGVIRYSFILSPAIFIIFATFRPERRLGNLVSVGALVCAFFYGLDRFQIGPAPTYDWKTLARVADQSVGPHDVLAFAGSYEFEPGFDYVIMSHYMGRLTRPAIFLTNRPDGQVLRRLAERGRVWITGQDPVVQTSRLFPGWRTANQHGVGIGDFLWAVIPPPSTNRNELRGE